MADDGKLRNIVEPTVGGVELRKVIDSSLLQKAKASLSMDVTEAGRVMEVSSGQL